MVALEKPAERDYKKVETYIFEKKPLLDEEYGFIYTKEDLITLRGETEFAPLDNLLAQLLKTFKWSFFQVNKS